MISMPVVDRNSGVQNLVSANKKQGFQSDAEEFGTIMQQSTMAEKQKPESSAADGGSNATDNG